MKVSSGGNFLGYDASSGKPYMKFKAVDSIPAEYKRVAKEHIPAKGDNAGIPHWRVYIDEMDVIYKGVEKRDSDYGPQFNMTVVDIETETEYVIPLKAHDLGCLSLLFAAVHAGPEFKIEFGKYPKVYTGDIVHPTCNYLIYEDGEFTKNPDFDLGAGEVWKDVCKFVFGAKANEAIKEIALPYKQQKLIPSKAKEFFSAWAVKLSEYLETLIEKQPKVEVAEESTNPAVADDDLPF